MDMITGALSQGDALAAFYVLATYLIAGGLILFVAVGALVGIARFARWGFAQIFHGAKVQSHQ